MKDWKSAARGWAKRNYSNSRPKENIDNGEYEPSILARTIAKSKEKIINNED